MKRAAPLSIMARRTDSSERSVSCQLVPHQAPSGTWRTIVDRAESAQCSAPRPGRGRSASSTASAVRVANAPGAPALSSSPAPDSVRWASSSANRRASDSANMSRSASLSPRERAGVRENGCRLRPPVSSPSPSGLSFPHISRGLRPLAAPRQAKAASSRRTPKPPGGRWPAGWQLPRRSLRHGRALRGRVFGVRRLDAAFHLRGALFSSATRLEPCPPVRASRRHSSRGGGR